QSEEVQIFEELIPFVHEEDNNLLEELLAVHAATEVVHQEGKNGNCNNQLEINKLGDDVGSSKAIPNKRTMHRDIERQRRQEMAGLYASLRSLLPLEYIKGKRAISDHMNEATNYIKDMQKKIEEMKIRRDKLSNLQCRPKTCPPITIDDAKEGPSNNISSSDSLNNNNNYVKVNLCRPNEVEILITSSTAGLISKVLLELLKIRGLNVVNCVSTRANDRGSFIHKIHIEPIEVNVLTCVDLSQLQKRLTNVINQLA
ncbi:hypothetical protein RD792_005294, partial [Penstemon davidsonii]